MKTFQLYCFIKHVQEFDSYIYRRCLIEQYVLASNELVYTAPWLSLAVIDT